MKRILLSLAALLLSVLPAFATNTIITSQIANAPGWQASHSYIGGDNFSSDRVLAGPGWAAGSPGAFTAGSNVYLWIDTTAGAATSSGSGNGPQTCTTPGSTTVVDGGITWNEIATDLGPAVALQKMSGGGFS